jgi:hypothetical protein
MVESGWALDFLWLGNGGRERRKNDKTVEVSPTTDSFEVDADVVTGQDDRTDVISVTCDMIL